MDHDFAAAVDTFSTNPLPTAAAVGASAQPYGRAFAHMASYWQGRLSAIPRLDLPNVTLPHTGGLRQPGDALDNAYKAAFVYTRIVEVGAAPFSAPTTTTGSSTTTCPASWPTGSLMGDFTDAQNLLLVGRISEDPQFNEVGANWYWDGPWRTPLAWADYLESDQ